MESVKLTLIFRISPKLTQIELNKVKITATDPNQFILKKSTPKFDKVNTNSGKSKIP